MTETCEEEKRAQCENLIETILSIRKHRRQKMPPQKEEETVQVSVHVNYIVYPKKILFIAEVGIHFFPHYVEHSESALRASLCY